MNLRITPVPDDERATLLIEGRLEAEGLPELRRSLEAGARALDVQNLLSVDEQGLEALRALRAQGIEIRNASHYLRLRLA